MIEPGLCVRCGRHGRAGGTFLCDPCRFDPRTRREIAHAEALAPDHRAQREVLIAQSAWAGGWGRRRP